MHYLKSATRSTQQLTIALFMMIVMLVLAAPALAYDAGTQIVIPSVNVSAPVVPVYLRQFPDGGVTWDVSGLRMNVGHLTGTPWFGQGGNVVLGGHSEQARGQADIFFHLDSVSVGDTILIYENGVELRYIVSAIRRVSQDDVSILAGTATERLTIMTCDTTSYDAGSGVYYDRVVVIADRTG